MVRHLSTSGKVPLTDAMVQVAELCTPLQKSSNSSVSCSQPDAPPSPMEYLFASSPRTPQSAIQRDAENIFNDTAAASVCVNRCCISGEVVETRGATFAMRLVGDEEQPTGEVVVSLASDEQMPEVGEMVVATGLLKTKMLWSDGGFTPIPYLRCGACGGFVLSTGRKKV